MVMVVAHWAVSHERYVTWIFGVRDAMNNEGDDQNLNKMVSGNNIR